MAFMRFRTNGLAYGILCVILIFLLVGICVFFIQNPTEEDLPDTEIFAGISVHFVDVGQGDAALIQTAEGNMIIDTGTPDSREMLLAYIDALGIETFQYAVFTHPHVDHIGGAAKVLKQYVVENVIIPDAVNNIYTYEKMMDAIERENCVVTEGKAGIGFFLGDVRVDLLAPVYADEANLNNMSVVTKITYGDVSFLFTGDAEAESESAMLMTDSEILDADVLKLGHHGSSTSSTDDFLDAVSPEIAIVSCGYNNDYGHPHREVVQSLKNRGIPMYQTYESGTIVVKTDGTQYTIETKK